MKPIDAAGTLEVTGEDLAGTAGDANAPSFLGGLAGTVRRLHDAVSGVVFAAIDALTRDGGIPQFLT